MVTQWLIQVVVAWTSEMRPEKTALVRAVDELNRVWASFVGVRIDLQSWDSHVHPAAGRPDAQAAINSQLFDKEEHDLFILILGGDAGGGGALGEFDAAHARFCAKGRPDIFTYLKAGDRSSAVREFVQKVREKGVLYFSFGDVWEFEQLAREHLGRFMQEEAPGRAVDVDRKAARDALGESGPTLDALVFMGHTVEAVTTFRRSAQVFEQSRQLRDHRLRRRKGGEALRLAGEGLSALEKGLDWHSDYVAKLSRRVALMAPLAGGPSRGLAQEVASKLLQKHARIRGQLEQMVQQSVTLAGRVKTLWPTKDQKARALVEQATTIEAKAVFGAELTTRLIGQLRRLAS